MSLAFLDTSALIKLYLPERGATWIRSYIQEFEIAISELALYECATLLRRHFLEGNLTKTEASLVYTTIQRDSERFNIVLLRATNQLARVVNTAFKLPSNLRLRALDAIQLTAAQIVFEACNSSTPFESFVFISSDRQLLQVAQQQGFEIENPEDYLDAPE